MYIVHSVALDEDGGRLFVADREHKRVLIFQTSDGKFLKKIDFENPVYAVAFNKADGWFSFFCRNSSIDITHYYFSSDRSMYVLCSL